MKKINLLVLPELFPDSEKDIKGIFTLDYLESVSSFCNINVFKITQTIGNGGLAEEYKLSGASVYNYRLNYKSDRDVISKLWHQLIWFYKGKMKIIKKYKNIQLIHAHGGTRYGYLARLVSRKTGIPYIITEHTGPFRKITDNPLKKYFCSKAMEDAFAVLCVSKDLEKQIYDSGISPSRTIVTYNPVDTELFQMVNDKELNKNILFVGRLEEYKGALRVVKAFSRIVSSNPGWSLTIVGDGPEFDNIQKFIRENHLRDNVFLKGQQNKQQIAAEMKRASFFVFPSLHETFGIVIAEAMSCGLPVICADRTAPPEFVNEESGILIDPSSIGDIAKAMDYLIKNGKNLNSPTIRDYVVDHFGFERFGNRLKAIYEEALTSCAV